MKNSRNELHVRLEMYFLDRERVQTLAKLFLKKTFKQMQLSFKDVKIIGSNVNASILEEILKCGEVGSSLL